MFNCQGLFSERVEPLLSSVCRKTFLKLRLISILCKAEYTYKPFKKKKKNTCKKRNELWTTAARWRTLATSVKNDLRQHVYQRHTVFVNICNIAAPFTIWKLRYWATSPVADAVIHPFAWFLVNIIVYWVLQLSQHKHSTLTSVRFCIIYLRVLSNGPWWWQPYCLSTSLQFLIFMSGVIASF